VIRKDYHMNENLPPKTNQRIRIRLGFVVTITGLVLFLLGIKPEWFGLDRSPILGFLQIAAFLTGLAFICLGGYLILQSLWNGRQKSILADIGLRMISTGFLIAAVTGFADLFGFGSQPSPMIPHFGHWQSTGVMIGQVFIMIGFIMMVPYPSKSGKNQSPPSLN
jgi:hypothetical protein